MDKVSAYSVQPLTRDAAERMGHIAWIEAATPVEAFQAMDRAVATAPFNCAVWANAGEFIPQETKDLIREWKNIFRPFGLKDCFELNLPQTCPDPLNSEADAKTMLRIFFNHAGNLVSENKDYRFLRDGLDKLHDHAVSQLENIAAALHPSRLNPDIRIGKFGDLQKPYPHTDSGRQTYRFIQSVESRSTYLVDNKDAVLIRRSESAARITSKPDIVFWEVPVNSVTLITSHSHHCQAILHDTPWKQESAEMRRAIVVYDIFGPHPA